MALHKIQTGWDIVHKFGHNADVDAAEDVWDGGGTYTWPAAAAETTIVSSDVADKTGSTGALTVFVQGLDSDYLLTSEIVAMDGTDAATLSNQYLRVFRAYVVTAGTGGVNAGNIQIKHGATVLAQISAGYGQTLMAIYTVPANYGVAGLASWYVTLGRTITSVAQVALQMRPQGGAWQTKELVDVSDVYSWTYDYPQLLDVSLKTDIRVRVLSVSAANTLVSAGFDMLLEEI